MTYCPHCNIDSATLRKQAEMIDDLQHKIETMRKAIVPSAPYIPGLTQSECLIVSALMMNEWVSTPMLYNVIAHRLRTRGEPPDTDNTVKVHIHRIRRKLAPMGITILNQYGRGYTIPEECKQILREKIAA